MISRTASSTVEKPVDPLPVVFRAYRAEIEAALRSGLGRGDLALYRMLDYNMGWRDRAGRPTSGMDSVGKALRPTLCLFACEVTGSPARRALPAAVALEFIHRFSLIHDDIQDRDETRHHRPTLWAIWGEPKALVAGNALRAVADMSLAGLVDEGVDLDRAVAVTRLLTEAHLQMIEGQYLDLSYESRPDIGMSDYLDMISRKTGALIRCSLHVGALIGTRNQAAVEAFRKCGESLGLVFQIRDDVLGVWGDERVTGKPVGADIRRKKNSLPVVYAMSRAVGADKEFLESVYRRDGVDDSDVDGVLEIMDRLGVRTYADQLASETCGRALAALAAVEGTADFRRKTEELAHFLLVREH